MATILMRNLFSAVKTRLRFDLLVMRKVKLLANECAVDIEMLIEKNSLKMYKNFILIILHKFFN